ncbi:hypothetical protein A4H97_32350 [Niastella yeongjuensis]|uniref:Uncharacterized protein n=1 Tax=Niastella yeongjuensis TaxID=354355 RepID=A0A1V9EH24_9BACT|nr:hypothetical protein [Niastella yeongjuensis]OQP45438.1 hypothetical protein A4H97_32350 [Niastella yeongjuensis]SEO75850.1 hypothetical protein SAMN05660816_03440 [Niastella yeongjuensis]
MKPAKKKPAEHPIASFLKSNLGYYTNPFGVQSDLLEDGAFNITAHYPGILLDTGYVIEICIEDSTIEEFSKLSGITTVEQLHFASPHLLLDLYHQGAAFLSVLYDNGECCWELVFRKKEGRIHVKDEDEDLSWVARKKLEKPADFINYITNYSKKH